MSSKWNLTRVSFTGIGEEQRTSVNETDEAGVFGVWAILGDKFVDWFRLRVLGMSVAVVSCLSVIKCVMSLLRKNSMDCVKKNGRKKEKHTC